MLNSVDLNQRPDKHERHNLSLECEAHSKHSKPTNFMQMWKASVIDSIDFNTQLNSIDMKETNEALNCAL